MMRIVAGAAGEWRRISTDLPFGGSSPSRSWDNMVMKYEGLPLGELDKGQQKELLFELLQTYVRAACGPGHAEIEIERGQAPS